MPDSLSSTASKTPPTGDRHSLSITAAPAVRRLVKDNNLSIDDIQGTRMDERVLNEDILKHIEAHTNASCKELQPTEVATAMVGVEDRRVTLSAIQSQMFKSMTSSLAIPHFIYTHSVNLTSLTKLRQQPQADLSLASCLPSPDDGTIKLTPLPFVLKALSLAVGKFLMMDSVLDEGKSDNGRRPKLVIKGCHNFGIVIDTPNGLLVPVVHNVQNRSILSIVTKISRLENLTREGKLTIDDMGGGTLVASNIGSIGSNAVDPVIVSPMTATVIVGKMEDVPAFEADQDGNERIAKNGQAVLNWSADHRVLDGATVARCGQRVAMWL